MYLVTNGWEATLAKYRPEKAPKRDPSVGEFLEAVKSTANLNPQTLKDYAGCLRRIVADIAGVSARPANRGVGHEKWLSRVHAVKLSVLTPSAIQQWKRDFLAKAGQNPVSKRSAKVSVNTYLRCARSLFAPKVLKHLTLELPDSVPFTGVTFEPKPSSKYRSTFDIVQLVGAAREELAYSDQEAYKVFLLAVMVGLRRKEIDLLEWSSFRWKEGIIRIEPTKYFSAKSEDSYSDIAVDPELLSIFGQYKVGASGPFVIESEAPPIRSKSVYRYYRCEAVFVRLLSWLRTHGVDALKPLHALRKEFGSVICASYGIHAASRALRHSALAVTDQYYTDARKRTSVGLGHLLEPSKVVEFKRESA
jgi:integrase